MFLSKASLWFLFCALLCAQCILGAQVPRVGLTEREAVSKSQRHHEPRANTIAHTNAIPTVVPSRDSARSIGVHIHPMTTTILPQAVGQVLIQAIFTAFMEFGSRPSATSNSFRHAVSSRLPDYNVEFEMTAKGNQTGDFVLTNSRIVETLSLLGFDYSNQQNVSSLVEYSFDVVVDVWMQPEVIIATGSVKNIAHDDPATKIVSTMA